MSGAVEAILPDGGLLLRGGPFELRLGLDGTRTAVAEARRRAAAGFEGLLATLLAELPVLRGPTGPDAPPLRSRVAQRMAAAARPFRRDTVLPVAALAGALAEEVLEATAGIPGLLAAYASQGGGMALFLAPGQVMRVGLVPALLGALPDGLLRIAASGPVRGIATASSPAVGDSEAVTVLAESAAQAGVAASLIAGALDSARLPDRPLVPEQVEAALDAGETCAEALQQRGLLRGALLALQGEARRIGEPEVLAGC